MSKLPNAPLVEVIFELRWKVDKNDELVKCQYLHGDLFAKVKETVISGKKIDVLKIDPPVSPAVILGYDDATRL